MSGHPRREANKHGGSRQVHRNQRNPTTGKVITEWSLLGLLLVNPHQCQFQRGGGGGGPFAFLLHSKWMAVPIGSETRASHTTCTAGTIFTEHKILSITFLAFSREAIDIIAFRSRFSHHRWPYNCNTFVQKEHLWHCHNSFTDAETPVFSSELFMDDFCFTWLAKLISERNAIEKAAVLTIVNWRHIKQDNEPSKQTGGRQKTDDNADQLPRPVKLAKCYVRQEWKSQKKSKNESHQMSVVIDHGQKPQHEEQQQHRHKFQ